MNASNGVSQADQKEEIGRLVSEAMDAGYPVTQNRGRRAARFSVGMLLDATTNPSLQTGLWMVTMHNVSESGIAFWSKKPVGVRSDIWVRESTEEDSAPWISAYVTHCTNGLTGPLVGARFTVND